MPGKLNLEIFLELDNADIRQKSQFRNFVNLAPCQSINL